MMSGWNKSYSLPELSGFSPRTSETWGKPLSEDQTKLRKVETIPDISTKHPVALEGDPSLPETTHQGWSHDFRTQAVVSFVPLKRHIRDISGKFPGHFLKSFLGFFPEISGKFPNISRTSPGHFLEFSRKCPGNLLELSCKFPRRLPDNSMICYEGFPDFFSGKFP